MPSQRQPPKVVIDTNVFVSALLGSETCRSIIDAMKDGRMRVIFSQKLLLELEQTVRMRPYVAANVSEARFVALQSALLTNGEFRRDFGLTNPLPLAHDPNDDYLVALAQNTGSVLVSGDRRMTDACPPGLACMSPSEFAEAILSPNGLRVILATTGEHEYSLN